MKEKFEYLYREQILYRTPIEFEQESNRAPRNKRHCNWNEQKTQWMGLTVD